MKSEMRKKAMEVLSKDKIDYAQWGSDVKKIIEELSIYQIELEHQNESLAKAQTEIEAERDRYMSLFETAPVSYILVDINGNIIHANETFNKTFGLDSQEIKGKSFEAHVQPECQDELYLYLKRTDKGTLQSGIEIKLNFYGHIFIVHLTAAKEKEDVYRIALIDLTDNVMMKNKIEDDEKQLEYKDITRNKIVEVLPDILYFYDPETRKVVNISKPVESILGYSCDEILNMSFNQQRALVLPNYRKIHAETIEKLMQNDRSGELIKCEFKLRAKDGKIKTTENVFTLVHLNKDMIIVRMRDITKEKMQEERLKKSLAKAKEAEHLEMAFLANMSHEIRTPLNSIVGFSQLLVSEEEEETREEYNDIIMRNNDLLLQLIDDILDLSKIEAGTMDFTMREFEVVKLFNQACTVVQAKTDPSKVKVLRDCKLKKLIIVSALGRIEQIANNFISNAVKFTKEGSITIGADYKDNGLYIYLKDTGIGIPKDKQNMLFQRFSKLDNFTQGTGLGLSISKAIVERLNGKIGCESEEGQGSKFWIWIPCEAIEIERS